MWQEFCAQFIMVAREISKYLISIPNIFAYLGIINTLRKLRPCTRWRQLMSQISQIDSGINDYIHMDHKNKMDLVFQKFAYILEQF